MCLPLGQLADLFLQRLLPTHHFRPLGGVGFPVHNAVEEGIQERLQATCDGLDFNSFGGNERGGGLGGLLFFFLYPREHFVRPIGRQFKWFEERRDFHVEDFLADIRLVTPSSHVVLLGASVVGVSLLDFRRDRATTVRTAKQAQECLVCSVRITRRIPPTLIQNSLYGIEGLFGNQRFVFPFVHLAGIAEVTVIEWVAQQLHDVDAREEFAVAGADAVFTEELPDSVHRDSASGIALKRFANDRPSFGVHDDHLGPVIVQVAERGRAGIFATADLLAQSALGVLGERIDVILALAEHQVEHEFALRVGLEAEGRELEVPDLPDVQEVDHLPPIDAVASEPIRVPGQDAVGFAGFQASEHVVEDGAAGGLGGLLFDEFGRHRQVLTLGELAKLGELGVDGQDLLVLDIGGFAGVKEKGVHGNSGLQHYIVILCVALGVFASG